MIRIQLLGGASLRSGDAPIGGPPAQRHRIALLALVAGTWPQPVTRDRAMALLWPERDTASGRRLLNLAVHVLRSALGESVLSSAGDALLFDPSTVSCDLHALRGAIAASDADRVVRLYTGPLLDGFHLDESTEFGYWLDDQRAALAHAYEGALLALAERQEREGDVHGRVGTCRRLVAADPHSAANALALMRALDAAGDRAGARHHAVEHANRVRADLDLEPDPEIAAFADRLRAVPSRVPAVPRTVHPTVAVLPFRNLSTDPDNACFADGITEDVIAQLAKIGALTVISHGSARPFRRREQPLAEIGRALGARALLDGSVRRAGNRIRIVVQLVGLEPDRLLWSETFDRDASDVFAIQTEVALHIATALEAELSAAERTRLHRRPTSDLVAYHRFLQGRQWLTPYSNRAIARALEQFERAVARDPGFALAHAHIGMVLTELAEAGIVPPEAAYGRAREAIERALALDPDLGLAHCALAFLEAVRELDFDAAEAEFHRAVELSPGSADICDLYGRFCAGMARFDEAIALLQRASELDPLTHRIDLVTTLLRAGRIEEGLVHAIEANEVRPGDRASATLGWALFLAGRHDEGIVELERAVASSPENLMWLGQLGEAYGLAGHADRARRILRQLERRARTEFVSPFYLVYVHAGLGDADRAVALLERAAEERTGPVYGIKGSFLLAPLREHPGFRSLLRRLGMDRAA
jgi:serine/threonine-protein kinase